MHKNHLCISHEQLYFCQLSFLHTHVLKNYWSYIFEIITTKSSNLTVCTGIDYKTILIVKAFAAMSS